MSARIEFEILEPLMFKSSSEFAPGVVGPHAHANSVPLPYPSTAAGTICSLILESMNERKLPIGDWSEQMTALIGEGARLRGPYVLDKDSNKIFVQCDSAVVGIEDALAYAGRRLNDKNEDDEGSSDRFGNIVKSIDLSGVKLTHRKASEEGMLFFERMIDFAPKARQRAICFDLVGESKNIETISFPKIVKFGGEGRVARVSSSNSEESGRLVSFAEKHLEKARALYVASPIVFKGGDLTYGEDLEEQIRKIISSKYLNGQVVRRIVGKVDLIGMGFPVARLQRKPIYSAIFPGSMIQFGEGCQVTGDVCESGIGEFSNLGYGTVIPFS